MSGENEIHHLPKDQAVIVGQVTSRLAPKFDGVFSKETVERFVTESMLLLLVNARISTYLSLLTEKFARDRLTALSRIEFSETVERPAVVFLCVQNAGRSQMASAWLKSMVGDRADIWSGGSNPSPQLNSSVVDVMNEVGIDLTQEFPKPWTDEIIRASDVIITMGCGDSCPIYPGKKYEDWQVPDPEGQPVAVVREIRDDIRQRVESLVRTLEL